MGHDFFARYQHLICDNSKTEFSFKGFKKDVQFTV